MRQHKKSQQKFETNKETCQEKGEGVGQTHVHKSPFKWLDGDKFCDGRKYKNATKGEQEYKADYGFCLG